MYTNETKDKFIELRAAGRSLCDIAKEIQVSKRTLVDWNQQFREEVRKVRAIEVEAIYDKIIMSRENQLKWMVHFHKEMLTLMSKRGFSFMKEHDLLHFILVYGREIAQLRAEVLGPLDQPPIPEPAGPVSQQSPAAATPQVNGNGQSAVVPAAHTG